MLRRVLGTVLVFGGVLALLVGATAMVLAGRDNRIALGEHTWETDGVAVVSAADLVAVMGPTLHLSARSTSGSPVFLGVAHTDDATNYLADSSRLEVSTYTPPTTFGTRAVAGAPELTTGPDALDWWVARADGEDAASLDWEMVDGHHAIVIMNLDGTPAVSTSAEIEMTIEGVFETALAVAAGGVLGLAVGMLAILLPRRRTASVGGNVKSPAAPSPGPTDATEGGQSS